MKQATWCRDRAANKCQKKWPWSGPSGMSAQPSPPLWAASGSRLANATMRRKNARKMSPATTHGSVPTMALLASASWTSSLCFVRSPDGKCGGAAQLTKFETIKAIMTTPSGTAPATMRSVAPRSTMGSFSMSLGLTAGVLSRNTLYLSVTLTVDWLISMRNVQHMSVQKNTNGINIMTLKTAGMAAVEKSHSFRGLPMASRLTSRRNGRKNPRKAVEYSAMASVA
mmetsp:Transcript_9793/g.29619  ORF Transcript_9793/g.29619 Transcript_9793/m.29619 type:complete len:226 (-) Transcript_9793:868-1545(-)